MTVLEFLAKLKDTPLEAELVFQTNETCSCQGSGQRCYCSHDPKDREIESVMFEKVIRHPDSRIKKVVVLIQT